MQRLNHVLMWRPTGFRQTHKQRAWQLCVMLFFTSTLSMGQSLTARADLAVIINKNNTLETISKESLRNAYLGELLVFPNDIQAIPLDLTIDNPLSNKFYSTIIYKSPEQVRVLWSKLVFAGRGLPPRIVRNTEEAKKLVVNNISCIAYIDAADVDDSVKVIMIIPTE